MGPKMRFLEWKLMNLKLYCVKMWSLEAYYDMSSLLQKMASHRIGNKLSSEPVIA